MQEKIYFYYTNDLHSSFEHWSRVVGFLKQKRERNVANHESNWLVDIGDHIDRVDPIAEAFMGKANVKLMNEAGYDIVTLGNNEGITMSHDNLYHLYDEANFEVVCANLHSEKSVPDWLNVYTNITSVQGVQIAVIGLTAPFNDFYELLGWYVSEPAKTLEKYIKKLKETSDIIVLLSHLGINEDRELARRFPDLDVIIGGHTHHLLRTGEEVNNSIITAAGKHSTYVGQVILTWDHGLGKLVKKEAYTTNITHMDKDIETEEYVLELKNKAFKNLSKVIVHLDEPINVSWFNHSQIMGYLTDTTRKWTKADIGMLNAGLLVDQIPQGDVTYGEIHRICPHPINPCVVELSGSQVIEAVRASLSKEFVELELKGFGFRGEVIGRMIFSGIEVETVNRKNGEEYVERITRHGIPLNSTQTYTIALPDTFTFGRLFPEVARSKVKKYFVPEFIRDLLAITLKEKYGN